MKEKRSENLPELTRVSSKGQVVIPSNLRNKLRIKEGSVFAISSFNHDMLILKKVKSSMIKEDLEIAKKVKEAWKEIERGEYDTYTVEEFLKKLDKM